ncbi:hypothetical protein [Micromonospora sp. RP3T]|uniref:hypothetical protein n=1 Tax=Micromonospora sp. RP3T TaxID=2135446 RepID=UPI003D72980E
MSELGKKLAEKWLSLVVLPGALYLVVLAAVVALGHAHPFDVGHLVDTITSGAAAPEVRSAGGQVVLLLAILGGAAVIGLVAQALGAMVERLWLASDWRSWPKPLRALADRQVRRRHRTWVALAVAYGHQRERAARALAIGEPTDKGERAVAYRALQRVSVEEPDRPSWSGDRIHAVSVRILRDLQVDLPVVWPYLWLTVSEAIRTELVAARQVLGQATMLSAWAVLYLPLVGLWWPAPLLSVALGLTSWSRTRTAADNYAALLEATVRLHGRELADRLGLAADAPFGTQIGADLTRHLTPSPPSLLT